MNLCDKGLLKTETSVTYTCLLSLPGYYLIKGI